MFGSFALKYVGRQYATFLNDESIRGYATLDLSVGLHVADWIDGKRTDLRLNAINVTDPHVLSGVQGVTANAQDAVGRSGTIVPGLSPTYYVGSGRAVMATLSRAVLSGMASLDDHRVHGMGTRLEAPTWPAITAEEAEAAIAHFPHGGTGGGVALAFPAPVLRPLH